VPFTTVVPPVATTAAASGLTSTGATLNGSVNPNGSSTNSFFQYSTDPSVAGTLVSTVAGTAPGSTDGTGAAARFNFPRSAAVDRAGNVYVADTSNDTIRKITPGGVVTTLAGTAGQAGSTDGTGSAARFFGPSSVAVDTAGNVYVTDAG